MPIGKCAFCGTYVTGGGTSMGKNAVACTACTPLALKWLERNQSPIATTSDSDAEAAG